MKTLKVKAYAKKHKYYTVGARLNYYEMIEFRKLQSKFKLTSSEVIRKLIGLNGNCRFNLNEGVSLADFPKLDKLEREAKR